MELHCTFLGNCGLLIEAGEDSVLVDAPNGAHTLFDGVPQEEIEKMAAALPPYQGLCGLFFTHRHSDHYDKKRVRQVTEQRPALTVFSPNGMTPPSGCVEAGPFSVSHFAIAHSGAEFAEVFHRVLAIRVDGRLLYVTGDADWTLQSHLNALGGERPDAVFCNPNFLTHPEGRELLQLCGRAFVYHMPFLSEDTLGIGRKCRTCLGRYGAELPELTVIERYPTEICF